MADREREFREFFDAEFRPLRRLAYMLTGDWQEAEDLAQETMVRTYRAWSRIRERTRPDAYARTVLVNRHRSLLRRSMVEAKHRVARMPDPAPPSQLDDDHLLVWQALGELPPREREAVVLRFFADLSQAEIAEVMRCPVGTVKSMTHRALGRLREALGSEVTLLLTEDV